MLTKCLPSRVDYACSGASDTWPGIASRENSSQKPLASRDGPPTNFTEPNTESQMV